jgi:hypothetical protein
MITRGAGSVAELLALVVLAGVDLVELHGIDGRTILINPAQVTSVHAQKSGEPNSLLHGDVYCLINLGSGKFVSVVEHCDQVRTLIEDHSKEEQ